MNRYFVRIDILIKCTPSPFYTSVTAIEILKCIYIFYEDLEKMDEKLYICGSIGLDVN